MMLARKSFTSAFTWSAAAPILGRQRRYAGAKATAANVKAVRAETGLPMKICRQALENSGNDVTAALAWIEETEGQRAEKAQAKVADRAVTEGVITVLVDDRKASLVHLGCGSDFVARNEMFVDLGDEIAAHLIGGSFNTTSCIEGGNVVYKACNVDPASLAEEVVASGENVGSMIGGIVAQIGENIQLQRGCTIELESSGILGRYIHNHGTFGCAVGLGSVADCGGNGESNVALANKVAQHIVAMDPGFSYGISGGDMHSEGIAAVLDAPFLFDPNVAVGDMLAIEAADFQLESFVRWGVADEQDRM